MLLILLKMLPLVLMAVAGYALNRLRIIDTGFNRQLSLTLINVFYPSLIIHLMVSKFTLESLATYWVMPVGLVFILCSGWGFGWLVRKFLRNKPVETQRGYHFICMMNNYSFLPIMMAASMWGEEAVALIVFSSLGSELSIWTLGIRTLTGHKLSRASLKHLVSMPMVALMIAFVVILLRAWMASNGLALPPAVAEIANKILETCRMLSGATIPVAALVCGSRMATMKATHIFNPMIAGMCGMRLVLIPAFCVAVVAAIPLPVEVRQVLFLIAVQPAAMSSVALTEAFSGDTQFAAAATFATHILCLISIPLWLALLL